MDIIYLNFIGRNDFAQVFKSLTKYRSENNLIRPLK